MVFHNLELQELYHQWSVLKQLANFCTFAVRNPSNSSFPQSIATLLFISGLLLLLCYFSSLKKYDCQVFFQFERNFVHKQKPTFKNIFK